MLRSSGLSSVPRFTLELCKPRSRTQKMPVSKALGPFETRPSASKDLGEDSQSPFATEESTSPQVSTSLL